MKEKKLILIICLALVAGLAYTIFACLFLVPSGINLSKTGQCHDYSSNGNIVTNRCKYCNKHYDCVRNVHSWVDPPQRHCEYCKIDYDCKTYTHKWASGNGSSYDNIPLDTKCKYCKMRYDCANDLHKYHPGSTVQKGVRYICKHCSASHVCEKQGHKWVEMKVCCPTNKVPFDDQHDERGIVTTICRICNTVYDCSKFGHDWSGCGEQVHNFNRARSCRGECRKCGSVSGDFGCVKHRWGNHGSAMRNGHCEFYDN